MKETVINIATRDRPTELSLLLLSLKNQTYQDFDILILEDFSGTPLPNYHFFNCVSSLIKLDGHDLEVERSPFNYGVSRARHELAEKSLKRGYKYIVRVDDDVILQPDFLEKLIKVINEGYDIASGTTPVCFANYIRNPDVLKIGNRVVLDEQGNFIMNMDDFGYQYSKDNIIPAHHFRSSALMKREVLEKVKYWPTRLSKHGFREEQIFSFKAIKAGFKIGNHMTAVAWHLCTPSGGERFADSNKLVKLNQEILEEETKKMRKEGDFIEEYNEKLGIKLENPDEEELNISTNLVMK